MRILALDMAKLTGWAHSDGSSGVRDFSTFDEPADRWLSFYGWLDRMQSDHRAEVIAYEAAHMRGGAPTRSALGYETCVRMFAAARRLRLLACHTATLKKHATGNGRATKDDMMAAAIRQHPTVRLLDDNHVDALWLLHWAQHQAESAA